MDDLELRAAIDVATQEALEIADALSEEILNRGLGARASLTRSLDYQEKRREIRRLRRALKVEVGG